MARDPRTPILPGIVPARLIKTVTIGTSEPAQRRPGGYEWGCQILLFRALRWRNDHSETTPRFLYRKNVIGLVAAGNAPAEAMLKFALDHPALKRFGVTGAMAQFSLDHACQRHRLGDEKYFRHVGRRQDVFEFDETEAFPEEANAIPR